MEREEVVVVHRRFGPKSPLLVAGRADVDRLGIRFLLIPLCPPAIPFSAVAVAVVIKDKYSMVY
jgi:hypothetical protein